MRDLVQFWGWRGGGATSWDQRERERSVSKMAVLFAIGSTGAREVVWLGVVVGKRVSRWVSSAERRSGREVVESRSIKGCTGQLGDVKCDWRTHD